jgi:hypothetical protein
MTFPALKRRVAAAATVAFGLLIHDRAEAGPNKLNNMGEADLTYTYVLKPGDAALSAAELTSLENTLKDGSRHLCRATDGLVKVTHWLVDPAAKLSDADVVSYPRVDARAFSGGQVVMFKDFLDERTLGHELGHYVAWLPDQYQEQRRSGESFGIGGAFLEANSAVSTAINGTDNTMMEDQFLLASRGLEFQLSHDRVYDLRHGDDNPNQSINDAVSDSRGGHRDQRDFSEPRYDWDGPAAQPRQRANSDRLILRLRCRCCRRTSVGRLRGNGDDRPGRRAPLVRQR